MPGKIFEGQTNYLVKVALKIPQEASYARSTTIIAQQF